MFSGSTMQVDPDMSQAHLLRGWYDQGGKTDPFRSQSSGGGAGTAGTAFPGGFNHSDLYPIAIAQDKFLGLGEKPDYFSLHGTVVYVREENIYYTSCPGPNCQKKVFEQDDGSWRCEKCGKSYESCEYRYVTHNHSTAARKSDERLSVTCLASQSPITRVNYFSRVSMRSPSCFLGYRQRITTI